MAFPKKLIDRIGIALTLMVLTLQSIVANIDCNGKPFHCVNSTHFMICVDLGSGVSSTIDDFVIECPPPTVCQRTNKFECDFPMETSVTVAPLEAPIVTSVSETLETVTSPYALTTSVPIEQYFDTSTTTTLSEDVLITHQTIAIVTESTTQLVTDMSQNNEVIVVPSNETIPSLHVQNDLITTTSLPNNIRVDVTETISNAFANVNVTVPETELNSTVTENILSTDAVHSEVVLITNQTIAIVTESTTQLVTNVTQNNEVIIPLNETIPSVHVQNDLIATTSLLNNIRFDATETTSDAFANVNVTVPETELNSTVTENILSAGDAIISLTTASTLPNNISALDAFPVETEKVSIITHESITNSTLNETIQSATEFTRNEQSLYTTSSTGMLSETTTETYPSLVGIKNNVTTPQPIPMYISANITGTINDTAENKIAIISVSTSNSTFNTIDPSEIIDVVTTVLSNNEKNITDLIKDPVKNITLSTTGVKSQLNLSGIVDSTTDSILYNVKESIPSTQNDQTKLMPNNSSDHFLYATEKVSVILPTSEINSTLTVKATTNVDVVQHESTLNNSKSDYVTNLIPNASENIEIILSDITIQNVIDVAQNEPTLLSTSNSTIITTTSTDMVTESTLTEKTKLTSNETHLSSEALPILINNTTIETILNNVSETILNKEAQMDLLLNNSSVNTKDNTKINSVVNETTSKFQSNTAQNELTYISTSKPSPVPETITEVFHKVTVITQNVPISKISLSLDEAQNIDETSTLLSNKFTTEGTYSMLDATDTTALLPESTIDYSFNVTNTSMDVRENDSTTPLPSKNDFTTVLILATTENANVTNNKYYSTLNETHTVQTKHTLLVNVSSSTALPNIDTELTWEKPIQIVGETTPSTNFEQSNFTKTLHENNTLSAADLILDVKENVLVPGSETKLNETRNANFVQNETKSITLPATDLITEATKSVNINMLEPERNPTLNVTVPRADDIVQNYSDTLNIITFSNNNADLTTESILGEVARPNLSVDTVQTSYTSNTTLTDTLVNIVTEFPVINVIENVIIAETNLTSNDSSLGNPEEVTTNSSNSSHLSNKKKVVNENIVSNSSQPQPYAQNFTASKPINIEPIYNNAKKLSVNEINQVNSTVKVSMTSPFNLTTTFVNGKNKTVVDARTVFPEDLNAVTFSNINIDNQTSSVITNNIQENKIETSTINKEIVFTSSLATLLPNYLADATSEQNIESSTQHTDNKNDSYVKLNFLESVKGRRVNIPNTVQITLNPLIVENGNLEIVPVSSTNPDTTTSTSELVNQGHANGKTDTYTIHKETTDTASEYGMRIFQTEFPTERATVVADTLAPATESTRKAYITDSANVKNIAGVTESYSQKKFLAGANSDTNTLMESSVSAVNIGVETTTESKPILLFNSSSEGHITTATSISSKSLPAQDTVNPNTTNILFSSRAPSSLAPDNMAASVQHESYTESTVNRVIQKSISNEITTNKIAHTILNADSSTRTLDTSAVHKHFTQDTKNLESHTTQVLGNTSENKQETILEKSKQNLPKMDQNQGIKTNKRNNTLLDILLHTPIHLMVSSQPTVPQTKYAADYTPINTLSIDNITYPTDDYADEKVPIKVETETKLGIERNPTSTQNEGTNNNETVNIKHGKGDEQIVIQTMNVSRLSQPKEESPQISNSSQTSIARTIPADQENVTLKLNSPDVLTIQPTTEPWRAKVVTKPHKDQDVVTSKQYLSDTPTPRSSTESWRAIVTGPYINPDYATQRQHFAITSGFKSSTEPWTPTVVTALQIDQETVTLKQYSTDYPTLKPSTEAWRTLVVTKPDIGVATTQPALIKIEQTEPRGKLSPIKDTIQSANKPNEGISLKQRRVPNTDANEKPLIDVHTTTEPFIESWSKVPQNSVSILDQSQSNQPITQKTESVITKTLASKIDIDLVIVDVVKTNVSLSKQSNSPTGTYPDISLKLPRTEKGNKSEPEEIESVEPPEENEEQELSEIEESQRENIEEKLEASENQKGELNKAGVVLTQNNIRFGSTVEMTTKKVEDKSYRPYKSITNIEVKPTIVKSKVNLEETKVETRKQIGRNVSGNIENSTVGYSLSKSFVNTHKVTAPVFEPAKSSFICKLNSRGKFPDNNDCRKFYFCVGKHEPIEGLCPNNTVFSELRKQCTKNFSHCVRNNQFQCVLEGHFSDYLNDNIYYICVKNNVGAFIRFKLQCQSGYHLNKTSVRCALNTEWSLTDEESQREKIEEKLEASENQKSELNKSGVVSTQNNIRFGSTVQMITKKVEDKSYRPYKSISNIEVQPTIVKSKLNLEETKLYTRKQIGNVSGNVENSKFSVAYSLTKSFVNTHNVTAPVFEPAKSSFVCKLNSRGKFPDNNDCRKFYFCFGKHEPIEGLCPNNTVFSELRKQCTKNFSHCVRNNQFQCVLEGRFIDYLNDNIYYICVKNNVGAFIRFKLQCQSGYHLNKTSVRCALNTEWSRLTSEQSISDISKNSEQSLSSAISEKLVIAPSNKFECKSEGKFPDPNNSRNYYVCSKKNGKSRYRLKRKKCESDEIFHKDKKKCVDAESYDYS